MNQVRPPDWGDHSFLGQINDPAKKETLLETGGIGRRKRALKIARSRQPILGHGQKTGN